MSSKAPFQVPESLSPMERVLAELLQKIHADLLAELRTFRWQMLGLIVFLVAGIMLLKGIDPNDAARVVPSVTAPTDAAPEEDESFPATVPTRGDAAPPHLGPMLGVPNAAASSG